MATSALRWLTRESAAATADNPILVILGNAGAGKTHLLCDVAERALAKGCPTLLLRGIQFSPGMNVWKQIFARLHFACDSPEEFLGALQACASAHRGRALIMIDALNEGDGASIWREHLPGARCGR